MSITNPTINFNALKFEVGQRFDQFYGSHMYEKAKRKISGNELDEELIYEFDYVVYFHGDFAEVNMCIKEEMELYSAYEDMSVTHRYLRFLFDLSYLEAIHFITRLTVESNKEVEILFIDKELRDSTLKEIQKLI